jgi:hypothetical protein
MPDLWRFFVFILAALLLFVAVVRWVIRGRIVKPGWFSMLVLATIVVPVGMIFARYSHLFFHDLPGIVYYSIPALITFCLPPLWFRMSRREIVQYVPLALLMAPVIHVVFSLLAGWHDYMPFPVYIPSLVEMVRGALR